MAQELKVYVISCEYSVSSRAMGPEIPSQNYDDFAVGRNAKEVRRNYEPTRKREERKMTRDECEPGSQAKIVVRYVTELKIPNFKIKVEPLEKKISSK